jgi:DNA polymerase elongation subunit (family B)
MNQSQANNLKPIMKPKVRAIGKYFKLIDFQTLDFSPNRDENSSVSSTETKKQVNQFHIQMFGLNETGDTCSITITDFHPFFYIQVANSWEQHDAEELLEHIKVKVGYFKTSILSIKIVDYNKLYGFTGGKKSRFAMIQFKNMAAFNKTKNLWYEYNSETNKRNSKLFIFKNTKLHLYESNIPPLLRYFHILNISPSGWVFVHTNHCETPDEKTTTCKYELLCSKKYVRPAADKENLAPYKICSFDIEASSSHGDFPLPKKTYKRLSSNIVDVFQNQLVATNGSIKTNPSRIMQLLTRIIMTAFGFDSFEDVDTIYPKKSPTKEQVKSLLENFFSVKIDLTAKNSGGEDEDTTIEEIFEKLKQNTYSGGGAAEGDADDDCEDEDGCGVGADADDVDDSDDHPVAAAAKKGPPSKMVANNSDRNTGKPGNHTVIDILLSDETRDTKIQQINIVFKRAGFPKIEGDKVTFIGSTFLKYGQTEPYLNHCLVLGSCDNIPGIEVQTAPTEQELLTNWTELIQRENPDIIIGYNIFGFDYEFMYQRAVENECCVPFLELSRKKEIWEGKNEDDPPSLDSTTIQIASGEYDLRYPKMVGRLQIDMYTYFRRDFNLSSYKLDDVAGEFICDKILKTVVVEDHGGSSSEVTQLYSKNLAGLNVGDFIHIKINGFSSDYYNNGQKFPVLKIDYNVSVIETNKSGVETTNTYNIISIQGNHMFDKSANIEWAMSKDDVTPQDIFRLSNGTSSDRAIVAKYCIQDCNLVHHLMSKIDVITGYVEMSRICSVPISFLIFRGQGIKLTSYVAKKCREKNTLMPDLEKTYSEDGYEGAIVLPPKCSMYIDNPVACVDYSSLYPSSMISQNYSHDSKVWSKEYDLNGHLIKGSDTGEKDAKGNYVYDNLPGYEYINIEFDTYKYLRPAGKPMAKKVKTKVGKKICRWAQLPGGQKSIMPSILEELLKARADTRKKIKTEPDAFMRNILDKRQNGYKVTANSLYGQCGARTSTFYEQDVAASTTATGRTMITYAKRMIEEVYGDMVYDTAVHGPVRCRAEYVYGDTDSVFFTFNLENPETGEKIRGKPALEMTIEIAQDVAHLCTSFLKPPMSLAYEKTLMPFILLSKKRYVGMLYEEDPNKGKLKYMGLVLKRRDNCDLVKDVYGGVLQNLMNNTNIEPAIQFLNKCLEDLIKGNIGMDKLAITKSLRSDYKNPQQIAHRVLADRIGQRDPGNKPKPGDRIKYLFITNKQGKLQGEKIETPEFITQNKLQIDYTYYITNQLMKPLLQLFGLAIEQIWEMQNKKIAIKAFRGDIQKMSEECEGDLELFMKKREKYTSTKVKTLLFEKFLTKIYNEQNKIQTIQECFFRKR